MPHIRFLREGKEVNCTVGENLRIIALREGMQLYGLKGKLGNCGGYGQCITCCVSIEGGTSDALSPLTDVEKTQLKGRPDNWRLACQVLVNSSVDVLTKPHSRPPDLHN